mgnify:CR=1 FL=1
MQQNGKANAFRMQQHGKANAFQMQQHGKANAFRMQQNGKANAFRMQQNERLTPFRCKKLAKNMFELFEMFIDFQELVLRFLVSQTIFFLSFKPP